MLRKVDEKELEEFEKLGFKYGPRGKFIYKTKQHGCEASIYIDLTPCHNNNNELKIEHEAYSLPEKIIDKIYDLIEKGLVEKYRRSK